MGDSDGFEDGWIDEDDITFSVPPPGEEAILQSHAGAEAHFQKTLEGMLPKCVLKLNCLPLINLLTIFLI